MRKNNRLLVEGMIEDELLKVRRGELAWKGVFAKSLDTLRSDFEGAKNAFEIVSRAQSNLNDLNYKVTALLLDKLGYAVDFKDNEWKLIQKPASKPKKVKK